LTRTRCAERYGFRLLAIVLDWVEGETEKSKQWMQSSDLPHASIEQTSRCPLFARSARSVSFEGGQSAEKGWKIAWFGNSRSTAIKCEAWMKVAECRGPLGLSLAPQVLSWNNPGAGDVARGCHWRGSREKHGSTGNNNAWKW
jgi:hypothetical protein